MIVTEYDPYSQSPGVSDRAAVDAPAPPVDFAGVYGESADGVGVLAVSSAATALQVNGKAHFSRSGKATVTAGHLSVTVTVHGGLAGSPRGCVSTRQNVARRVDARRDGGEVWRSRGHARRAA